MKRWKLISDLRILIVLLFLVCLIPGIALIAFRFSQERQTRTREVDAEVAYYATLVAHQEEQTFEAIHNLLVLLARSPQLRDRNTCGPFLQALLKQYPRYAGLGVADLHGDIYCSGLGVSSKINIADRPYFQDAIRTGDFAVGGFVIGRGSGVPVVDGAHPVMDPAGRVQSVIVAGVPLAEFDDLSAIFPYGKSDSYTLTKVDSAGTVLAHKPLGGGWTIGSGAPALQFERDVLADAVRVFRGRGTDGDAFIYASSPVKTRAAANAIYVITGIPEAVAMAEINQHFWQSLVTLLLISAAGLILAMIGAYAYVLRPVDALLQVSRRVLEGDYSARSGEFYGRAQLGRLARVFDAMAATVERRARERFAAEEKFRGILESAPDAMVIVDRSGHIVLVNKQTENLFQYSRDELIGNLIEILMPVGLRHGHTEYREQFVARPAARPMGAGLDLQGRRKDGSEFPVEISLSPLSTGEELLVLSAIRDVTERKRLEDELKKTTSQLRSLAGHLQVVREEERSRIARDIHDELGQSLSGLKMDLYSAARRIPKPDAALAEKMQASIKHVDDIICDVKRIAAELRPGSLDLGLLTAVESQAEEFESRTGIHCVLQLPVSDSPLDDPRSLAVFRIVQEALTNVAQHSGATKVEIVLRQGSRDLLLEVRDNGRGTDHSGSRHQESLGITGMQERAHLLGGTFEIQATPGHGTVVRVLIPLSNETNPTN